MNHHTNPGHAAAASPNGEADLLTITETADLLRVPVATLRYWRHRKTGPVSFRVGRGVRYQRADVTGWLDEQCNNS